MKKQDTKVTHPHKALFPSLQKTKKDIVDYYENIADYLLPYLKDRPLTLRRFPQGIEEQGFYNKHIPTHFPDFIQRIAVPMREENKKMLMTSANKKKDLIYFASQNVLEFHISLSKATNLENPDQMVFDLDPSNDSFENVRKVALELKKILDSASLPSYVKTTGSRGLHIHVPLKPESKFSFVKERAQKYAKALVEKLPDSTTLEQRKEKRKGKVFVDILRNDYGMTVIAPYSLRAQKEASIATPISWEELHNKNLTSKQYTLESIFQRLAQLKKDSWMDFFESAVSLKR